MQPIFMLSADFPTLSAPSSPSCVVDVISPTTYCGPTPPRPKAPLSGADSPYQGEMSRRDKRGRDAVSRRLTERSSQICCSLSVPAFRRAASPERGGFFAHPIYKNSTKIPSDPCNRRKRVVLLWRNPQKAKSGYPLFHLQKNADEVFCRSRFGKTDKKENGQ